MTASEHRNPQYGKSEKARWWENHCEPFLILSLFYLITYSFSMRA